MLSDRSLHEPYGDFLLEKSQTESTPKHMTVCILLSTQHAFPIKVSLCLHVLLLRKNVLIAEIALDHMSHPLPNFNDI